MEMLSKPRENCKARYGANTTRFITNLASRQLSACETNLFIEGPRLQRNQNEANSIKHGYFYRRWHRSAECKHTGERPTESDRTAFKTFTSATNLQRKQATTLQELQEGTEIVVLLADKGNSPVVLDREA